MLNKVHKKTLAGNPMRTFAQENGLKKGVAHVSTERHLPATFFCIKTEACKIGPALIMADTIQASVSIISQPKIIRPNLLGRWKVKLAGVQGRRFQVSQWGISVSFPHLEQLTRMALPVSGAKSGKKRRMKV